MTAALTTTAVQAGDDAALATLAEWTTGQRAGLDALDVPVGAEQAVAASVGLVDEVAAEVAQQATTGGRRLGLRRPALERRLVAPQLPQAAGVQQFAEGQEVRVPAPVLVGAEQHTFGLGQLHGVPGRLRVQRERLVADDRHPAT